MRPDPGGADAAQSIRRIRLSARQSARPASRALVSRGRLPALARGHARHHAPTRSQASNSPAMSQPRALDCRGQRMTTHAAASASHGRTPLRCTRLPHGGLIDRATPLAFSFDGRALCGFAGDTLASALARQWRPRWSAARSNIIVRAAFLPPDRRSRTRWSSCATERAASRTRAPRRSNCSTASIAASQNRWPSLAFDVDGGQRLAVAVLPSRLLLQDLHVAGGLLGEGLRAVDPPRGGSRPAAAGADDPDEYEKAFAHLRRSGHRLGSDRA